MENFKNFYVLSAIDISYIYKQKSDEDNFDFNWPLQYHNDQAFYTTHGIYEHQIRKASHGNFI